MVDLIRYKGPFGISYDVVQEFETLVTLNTFLSFFWFDLFALIFVDSVLYRAYLIKKGQVADTDSLGNLNLKMALLLLPLGVVLSLVANLILTMIFGQVFLIIPLLIRIVIIGGILILILSERNPLRHFR
ncbi:MAG: hypothetical protein ACFFAE_05000 [Candidatus Hodarchaeota archaeon]